MVIHGDYPKTTVLRPLLQYYDFPKTTVITAITTVLRLPKDYSNYGHSCFDYNHDSYDGNGKSYCNDQWWLLWHGNGHLTLRPVAPFHMHSNMQSNEIWSALPCHLSDMAHILAFSLDVVTHTHTHTDTHTHTHTHTKRLRLAEKGNRLTNRTVETNLCERHALLTCQISSTTNQHTRRHEATRNSQRITLMQGSLAFSPD